MLGYTLRRDIEKLIHSLFSRWQTWTPTVTQGVAVAATVTYARQLRVGTQITLTALLSVTGAGTAGQAISIGDLPAAPKQTSPYLGLGGMVGLDSGAAPPHYQAAIVPGNAAWLAFIVDGSSNYLGTNPAWTLANGDIIGFTVSYEVA